MSQKCNIVILAAGRGERFAMEGISVPKPLIEFRGKSLLSRSVEFARLLVPVGARIVVVTVPQVVHAASVLRGVTNVIEVSVTQRGPAASGLLAMAHLPLDEPVIFMDCDNIYAGKPDLPLGSNFIVTANAPEGLERAQFCNVRLTEDGRVVDVAEKRALGGTSKMATGIYGFSSAQRFQSAAFCALFSELEGREIPMSSVLWNATTPEDPLHAVVVDGWAPVGTPQQMLAALAP